MTTQAQMDANRQNAAKGTGPKSVEGKENSRANALKHGMTSMVVVPENLKAVEEQRYSDWSEILAPQGPALEFELHQAVVASLRIEQCYTREIERRVELSQIAASPDGEWDKNRMIDAAKLAKSLKRDPQLVALQLRNSPAGRNWLIAEWNVLLLAVSEVGDSAWSDVESNRALDLMGKSKTLRTVVIQVNTPFADPVATRSFVLAEIAKLVALQCDASAKNDKLRALHVQGFRTEDDATLQLIRRYETTAHRRFDKSMRAIAKGKSTVVTSAPPAAPIKVISEVMPTAPPCETNPIPVARKPVIKVESPVVSGESKPHGNRRYRRYQQKAARHQEYLERRAR